MKPTNTEIQNARGTLDAEHIDQSVVRIEPSWDSAICVTYDFTGKPFAVRGWPLEGREGRLYALRQASHAVALSNARDAKATAYRALAKGYGEARRSGEPLPDDFGN